MEGPEFRGARPSQRRPTTFPSLHIAFPTAVQLERR